MYVRQVKQYLRAADEAFDERKFGFASIVEFLRACQREGLFRLERDRQGVLRVFPGQGLQRPLPVADAQPAGTDEPEAGDSASEPAPPRSDGEPAAEVVGPMAEAMAEAAEPVLGVETPPVRKPAVEPPIEEDDEVNFNVAQPDELPRRPPRARARKTIETPRPALPRTPTPPRTPAPRGGSRKAAPPRPASTNRRRS